MYKTILFDVDGVMLSEERCFDASALTVYEVLTSPQYLAVNVPSLPPFQTTLADDAIALIRRVVFADETVLRTLKSKGINANWDIVYLQVAFQLSRMLNDVVQCRAREEVTSSLLPLLAEGWTLPVLRATAEMWRANGIRSSIDFSGLNQLIANCKGKAEIFSTLDATLQQTLGVDALPFSYGRSLWTLCQQSYQEWYLGDAYVERPKQTGKPGFLTDEVPIVEQKAFTELLVALKDCGVKLGIATGRPALEATVPLKYLGWLDYFEPTRVTTASDVLLAERTAPERVPLAKPHPFSYLRSYLATEDILEVLDCPLPLDSAWETLVIGDSVADYLAAQAIGCDFAAVLTGLEGVEAKQQFDALGCTEIWDDVLSLWDKVVRKTT